MREREPTQKITCRVFEADLPILKSAYSRYGYQKAIRMLIRKHTRWLESQQPELPDIDINVDNDHSPEEEINAES